MALNNLGRKYKGVARMELPPWSTGEPIGKVKELIEDMANKLTNQVAKEADQKASGDREQRTAGEAPS